jgi:hypothetical protein
MLAHAFEDNEAPAAPTGVDGDEVSLVALVPGLETMPERKPDTTAAGNLTLRKLTKAERAELHAAAVTSQVLRTVREAFAVAPGLSAARIVALQQFDVDAYSNPIFEVMLAARFERSRLDGVKWNQANANSILEGTASELLMNVRRGTGELRPLDLRREPDLAAILGHIELDDTRLGEPRTRPLPVAVLADTPVAAPPPLPEPTPSNTSSAIRTAVAAAWLLLLVIALAGGLSTFLAMLGLPLLLIGLAALLVGRLRWAWITNRPVGGATAAAGLVLLLAGAGTAAPVEPAGTVATATTTTTASPTTTTPTTTTLPTPSPTTANAIPTTVAPLVTTQPPAPLPPKPPPPPVPKPQPPQTTTIGQAPAACDPSYPTVCIKPPPPSLNCGDIPYRRFVVRGDDPHGFDRDHDGIGCETG